MTTPPITVIGCDGRPLSGAARTALDQAARVAGARRHLDSVGVQQTKETIVIKRLDEALDAIAAGPGPVAVLASGDPGFFGIVRAIRERGIEPVVIPASSSVAMAFGRIGLDWDDALVLSAHGREPRHVLAAALAHPKAVILTGRGEAAADALAAELVCAGRTVYVAERLGTDDERIIKLPPAEPAAGGHPAAKPAAAGPAAGKPAGAGPAATKQAAARPAAARSANAASANGKLVGRGSANGQPKPINVKLDGAGPAKGRTVGRGPAGIGPFAEPNVLIAVDPQAPSTQRWLAGHPGAPDAWALPEDAFEHRDSMITKSEIRALALARLGPGPGRIIWDIGAGSGSIAVECARFGAWVIAVERDQQQCERIRRNAAAHHVYLRVRHGSAPQALEGLPRPDAIFVGGGGDGVLSAALNLGQPSRVVVTAASVDRVALVRDLMAYHGYRPDGTQLQASRITTLPSGSLRLAAANPVFVLWGSRAFPEWTADSGKVPGAPA
jgi:precorrin-6B C5,15-methyltransferase / cobalt-precorrin-6B C5,C15-methyltransferase